MYFESYYDRVRNYTRRKQRKNTTIFNRLNNNSFDRYIIPREDHEFTAKTNRHIYD